MSNNDDDINYIDLDCCVLEALIERACEDIEDSFDDYLPSYLRLDGLPEDILEKEEAKERINRLKDRFLTYLKEFRDLDCW